MESLEIVQLFCCLGRVKHLEFCCRSEYLLCALDKKPVQVRNPTPLPVHSSSCLSGARSHNVPLTGPGVECVRPRLGVQHRGGRCRGAARALGARRAARPGSVGLPDPHLGLVAGHEAMCALLPSHSEHLQAVGKQLAVAQACTSQGPSCPRAAWPSALTGACWRWQRCGPRPAGLLCPAHWIM